MLLTKTEDQVPIVHSNLKTGHFSFCLTPAFRNLDFVALWRYYRPVYFLKTVFCWVAFLHRMRWRLRPGGVKNAISHNRDYLSDVFPVHAAALMYEVVWVRSLSLVFGGTHMQDKAD